MRSRSVKILVCAILIWLVSASYSHYISSKASFPSAYLHGDDNGSLLSLWDEIIPGRMSLGARAAIAVDANSGEVIFAKNINRQLPIASLTKLATCLVFLQTGPELTDTITITGEDKQGIGKTRLYTGETITVYDCLHTCLMCSDNAAANALARSTGLSSAEFVYLMNRLASDLDMNDTRFVEPTGLHAGNVSTAADYVKLVKMAFGNAILSEISRKKIYSFKSLNQNTTHTLYNTNRFLHGPWAIKGGKTGYISKSGYCLALDIADDSGREIMAVVLGSPSSKNRYRDVYRLLTLALPN